MGEDGGLEVLQQGAGFLAAGPPACLEASFVPSQSLSSAAGTVLSCEADDALTGLGVKESRALQPPVFCQRRSTRSWAGKQTPTSQRDIPRQRTLCPVQKLGGRGWGAGRCSGIGQWGVSSHIVHQLVLFLGFISVFLIDMFLFTTIIIIIFLGFILLWVLLFFSPVLHPIPLGVGRTHWE